MSEFESFFLFVCCIVCIALTSLLKRCVMAFVVVVVDGKNEKNILMKGKKKQLERVLNINLLLSLSQSTR